MVSTADVPSGVVGSIKALITRTVGQQAAANFELHATLNTAEVDTFELESRPKANGGNIVTISGNSGPALASGFYHYLRWGCNSSVSWGTNRSGVVMNIQSGGELPPIAQHIKVEAQAPISFYMQPCTESYTSAFWDANDWAFEVDWMALHGDN
jgi:alpha-N-acetylglucosaminidase